jgi:PAS domain S-box-containing protein
MAAEKDPPQQDAARVPPQVSDAAELRRRAEEDARLPETEDLDALSPEQIRRTFHELRVHQIELEMQNEELRRTQAELGAAQARYIDFYDLAPVGYLTLSEPGLILEANLTAATILGVTPGALVERPFTRFVLPEDQDLHYLHTKRLCETGAADATSVPQAGAPQAYELRMLQGDGTAFWAHLEVTAARDAGGAPVRRIVMSDITERNRAEESLREAHQKLETTLDSITDGLLVLDHDWRYTYVSDTGAKLVGMRPEDLIGKCVWDLFPYAKDTRFYECYHMAVETGQPIAFEEFYPEPLNRWLECRCYPSPDGLSVYFRDITERKQVDNGLERARKELDAAHEYAVSIINTVREPLIALDQDLRVVSVNRSFYDVFKVSPEETVGQLIYDLGNKQWDIPKLRELLGTILPQQAIFDGYEVEHDFVAIGRRIMLLNARQIHRVLGKEQIILLAIEDVTERKRAEELLRESEERYALTLDAVNDGLWDWNVQSGDALFSPRYYALLGYDDGEFPANYASWRLLVHPEDLAQVEEELRLSIETGKGFAIDLQMKLKFGGWRWVSTRGRVVERDAAGKALRLVGTLSDITERKRAEEALRAASLYSRSLLETSLDPLVTISAEGRITDVNAATEKITGMSREWLIGSDFADYFTEPEVARAGYLKAFEQGQVTDYPLAVCHTSGAIAAVLYNASVYRNERGDVLGVFAAARDITERKHVEEKLAAMAAELERSNNDLEQFASVASHDLQEPLRMVASYTQLLAERYEGQLDEKAQKYIAYAVDGAVRMQRLVNDLLTYARVGTRGNPIAPTDAGRVLGQAIGDLATAIEESRAVVTHEELPLLRADASQLRQLFQNLLANALKFRSEEVPRVHVSARDEGRDWVFAVRDNGIGIDRQYAERVFVVFQRLHTRRDYPGTGIGLALCKRIVERHGGRIWFESEPGKGSTFLFTVPK